MGRRLLGQPTYLLLPLLALLASLSVAACGGSSSDNKSASKYADEPWLEDIASSDKVVEGKSEPEVTLPDTPPPKKLIVRDIVVGKGPAARPGDILKLEYVGINWFNRPYADSWTYPEVPIFELDPPPDGFRLEYGLDLGIRGMKPGGQREVIVPANLLPWPDERDEGKLSPQNSVVFIVDLFEILKRRGGG